MEKVRGTSKIRVEHSSAILNQIRRFGPVSRTEIYEKTTISKATVGRVIEDLLKKGFIRETGSGVSQLGRKPVQIELAPEARYCIGVNISRNHLLVSLVNFTMEVVRKKTLKLKGVDSPEIFKQTVVRNIQELITESGVAPRKILGVGIGAPGIVDYNQGIIVDFATAHWLMDIRLKEYLQTETGWNITIDNNANTRALGEYWYGFGTGCQNLIYVICSEGVGSGIIVDGKVLRGKNNITAGLGHMTVNADGRLCGCGRHGCVEAYSSTEALEKMTREALKQGRKSRVLEQAGNDPEQVDYLLICRCAAEGDALCREKLEEAAAYLSIGLANQIGIFNPEMIILSGTLLDVSPAFFERVKTLTLAKIFSPLAGDVIFKKRQVRDNLYEVGAATLIFKSFFKD
jgi:predicted NBD/HSP70 family sugar kinase